MLLDGIRFYRAKESGLLQTKYDRSMIELELDDTGGNDSVDRL